MAHRFSGGGTTIPRLTLILNGCGALLLAACATSENPADGGFLSGVSGLSSGTYDARIEERTAAVETEQARQAALSAELAALEGELAAQQRRIVERRAQAAAAGTPIPADLDARVNATLAAAPGGQTDAQRLQNYRRAVADARELANLLANI